MATWSELVEQRKVIIGRLEGMRDFADAEAKGGRRESPVLDSEELANYEKLSTDLETVEADITRIQKTADFDRRLEDARKFTAELEAFGTRKDHTPADKQVVGNRKRNSGDIYNDEFRTWLRTGEMGIQMRALARDPDSQGGYTIAPEEFYAELIRNVNDMVVVRGLARTLQTNAIQIGIPVLGAKLADATWGTELAVATADATMSFSKRRLTPHPLTAQILVSKLLGAHSSLPIDELITTEFARAIGETQERAFLQGVGSGQPLGCFIADPNGLSTTRDNNTASSSGNVTADNLINTFFSLKPQYRKNATWLLNRQVLRGIRLLKDNNNQYIWTAGIQAYTASMAYGPAPMILERPYVESEFAPFSTASTTGTGTNSTGYTTIVGDFKQGYWIADGPGLGVQRYDQINAATNQDTYIGLFQVDGAPVLEEAFARSRLST